MPNDNRTEIGIAIDDNTMDRLHATICAMQRIDEGLTEDDCVLAIFMVGLFSVNASYFVQEVLAAA